MKTLDEIREIINDKSVSNMRVEMEVGDFLKENDYENLRKEIMTLLRTKRVESWRYFLFKNIS